MLWHPSSPLHKSWELLHPWRASLEARSVHYVPEAGVFTCAIQQQFFATQKRRRLHYLHCTSWGGWKLVCELLRHHVHSVGVEVLDSCSSVCWRVCLLSHCTNVLPLHTLVLSLSSTLYSLLFTHSTHTHTLGPVDLPSSQSSEPVPVLWCDC